MFLLLIQFQTNDNNKIKTIENQNTHKSDALCESIPDTSAFLTHLLSSPAVLTRTATPKCTTAGDMNLFQ